MRTNYPKSPMKTTISSITIALIGTLLCIYSHAAPSPDIPDIGMSQAQTRIDGLINEGYQAITESPYTALQHAQHALSIAKQMHSPHHEADALCLMAESYMAMHLPDSAINAYQQAIANYSQIEAPLQQAYALMGLANIQLQHGSSEQSQQNIAQAQMLIHDNHALKEHANSILLQHAMIQDLLIQRGRMHIWILSALTLSLLLILSIIIIMFRKKNQEIKVHEEANQQIQQYTKQIEKQMLDEIKKREQQQQHIAQKSKLESLGNMAASIAHEINQPLGGISMSLDNILIKIEEQNLQPEFIKTKIDNIFSNIDRIKNIIDHVRNFSRTQKPISFEQTYVNMVVRNALSISAMQFEQHGVELTTELDDSIEPITADKYKLEQVMINLISNAKHAVDEKAKSQLFSTSYRKKIAIKTENQNTDVIISVWDNGIGIPSSIIDKIFDPFFTTKEEGHGTGLGLSISYNFIKDILGNISVESTEGEYTLFKITLPKI